MYLRCTPVLPNTINQQILLLGRASCAPDMAKGAAGEAVPPAGNVPSTIF
jgi:hypothetical protein